VCETWYPWYLILQEEGFGNRGYLGKRNKVVGDWRNCRVKASWFLLVDKYYPGDQIKKNETGLEICHVGHSMSSEPMKNPTISDFIRTW
jgi:hypothetical protein